MSTSETIKELTEKLAQANEHNKKLVSHNYELQELARNQLITINQTAKLLRGCP